MAERERGQVTVLALGLCLVCIAVAGLAVDGARAWIYKRTLQAAADAAAASGASALDVDRFYRAGGEAVTLDPERVEDRVLRLLGQRGLRTAVQITVRAHDVRVALRSKVDTTFLTMIGITRVPVTAEAVARPFLGDP